MSNKKARKSAAEIAVNKAAGLLGGMSQIPDCIWDYIAKGVMGNGSCDEDLREAVRRDYKVAPGYGDVEKFKKDMKIFFDDYWGGLVKSPQSFIRLWAFGVYKAFTKERVYMDMICGECGGRLIPSGGKNRIFVIRRGVEFVLPENFPVPTCEKCGADFIYDEVEEAAIALFASK